MLAGEKLTASVLSIGIVATPINTTSVGTPTTGSGAETFDIVLGYYQATLINGHRYRVQLDGLIGNCGTAGDIYTLQIRDSGNSSAPTGSATLVAQTQWTSAQAGTLSRIPVPIGNTFVAAGSGVHTFGFSSTRVSGGSGSVFTPESPPSLFRELYVTDLGGN